MAAAYRFADILLALRQQIMTSTGFPVERVPITARDNVPHWQAEQDVLLRVHSELPDVTIIGTGRAVNLRERTVSVIMRSRVQLDESYYDAIHLTDKALGHIDLEDQVLDAVELFQADASGTWLVDQPMRAGTISKPVVDPKAPEWVSSFVDLVIPYQRGMDQSYQ